MGECVKLRWGLDTPLLIILTVIFGFLSCVTFIVNIFRNGPSRMFGISSPSRNVRPEILANANFGSHEFVRLRSVRVKLHCVVNGPTNKPLMLFLHGFPEFWYSWRHQLKEFSRDYRTVAFDMRGYGDSDKPSGICQYTLDKLVEDVDQLITGLGYEKCILVGHDWGGAVAWGYAALHPDRVDRLIIGNCPHPAAFELHMKSGAFSQMLKSWYMFLFQNPVLPQFFLRADDVHFLEDAFCGKATGAKRGVFTPEDIEAYKYTFANYSDLSGPINYYRAFLRYRSPQVEQAFRRKISVPTLIIWGTNDGALEKQLAEMSRRFVDQFTLEYIEDAGHWIQQEEPHQFNGFMRQFLNDQI